MEEVEDASQCCCGESQKSREEDCEVCVVFCVGSAEVSGLECAEAYDHQTGGEDGEVLLGE